MYFQQVKLRSVRKLESFRVVEWNGDGVSIRSGRMYY